jgi:hypothetical protein
VLLIGVILLITGIFGAAKKRDWALLLLVPSMLLGAAAVFLFKHSIPPARIWIYLIPFLFVLADSGLTYLGEKLLPRGRQFLLSLLLVALGLLYSVSLMSRNAIAEGSETGPFPEAPFLVRYLKPLLSSNDIVQMGRPGSWPVQFYFWYYGVPGEKGAANPGPRREFFIVKKSRYTISDLTQKPVTKLLDFDDAALYQLVRPEEIRAGKEMDRTNEGLRLIVTKVPPRVARKPQHEDEED